MPRVLAAVVPTSRFRILKDTLGYSASALMAQGLGLVAGFWIARLLGPTDFGIWNAVSLVLVYGAYVDFGVLSAMGRDMPFHHGQGETAKAAMLEGAARWATLTGAVLAAAAVMAASFFVSGPPMMRTGLRVMALVLVLQQAYTYHRTVLRARNEFGELSRQQVLQAVLAAVLGVLFVTLLGLRGRLIAAVVVQAAMVVYAIQRSPWRPVPRVEPSVMKSLVRIGVPITVSGSIVSLVTTIDRVMVVGFLGETQLGYFGLALLLTSLVSLVPAMASQVLYPRITFQFGQSGSDLGALRPFVMTPPIVLACLLPVVIGPIYVVLPVAIAHFLPDYVPGILATRIVILGIFFYSILGLTDYFLVTTGRLMQYALFGCGALAVNLAADYAAIRMGYGIEGVAVGGTPLTYFVYSTVVIGYALSHYARGLAEWARYFARLWLPFVYMLAVLWVIDWTTRFWPPPSTGAGVVAVTTAQVLGYLAASVPLVMLAAREMKLDLSLATLARVRSGR